MMKCAVYLLLLASKGLVFVRAWVQQPAPLVAKLYTVQKSLPVTSTWGSVDRLLMMAAQAQGEGEYNNQPEDRRETAKYGKLGGRKRRRPRKEKKKGVPLWSIPTGLLILMLFKGIWWLESDPGFVYYESSVYETRVYNGLDGKVESSRKESFRSNIPSLVEQGRLLRQQEEDLPTSSDAEADEVLRQIDEFIRIQDSILDDIF